MIAISKAANFINTCIVPEDRAELAGHYAYHMALKGTTPNRVTMDALKGKLWGLREAGAKFDAIDAFNYAADLCANDVFGD